MVAETSPRCGAACVTRRPLGRHAGPRVFNGLFGVPAEGRPLRLSQGAAWRERPPVAAGIAGDEARSRGRSRHGACVRDRTNRAGVMQTVRCAAGCESSVIRTVWRSCRGHSSRSAKQSSPRGSPSAVCLLGGTPSAPPGFPTVFPRCHVMGGLQSARRTVPHVTHVLG